MKSFFITLAYLCAAYMVYSKPNTNIHSTTYKKSFRQACTLPVSHKVLAINNIRMQLSTNGDTWWDINAPSVAFKFDATKAPVAALFATGVWAGGIDIGGNLKMACSTYRANGNDWFAGPLDENTGTTMLSDCINWDKHFSVSKANIENFRQLYFSAARDIDGNIIDKQGFLSQISDDIKGWPARGNPFFKTIHGFDLPENNTFLAAFFDRNLDGLYNPTNGDYPIYLKSDGYNSLGDITFWIFNDEGSGANHTASKGKAIGMEVHAYTYAAARGAAFEDMENTVFQTYRYIYKGADRIDSAFLAYWVDPAIGCEDDDYVGFDHYVSNQGKDYNYMYAYNADNLDGNNTCGGYGQHAPIIAISDFTGYNSLQFFFPTIRSSFMYYVNGSADASLPEAMSDPTQPEEYYRLMNQKWKDGTPLTIGGSGYRTAYEPKEITNIPFFDAPNDKNGWSMINSNLSPKGDYRMLACGGPMQFRPGSIITTDYAITAVPNQGGGAVDLTRTRLAIDNARRYIDEVFYEGYFHQPIYGPTAPGVNTVSTDKAVTLLIENTPPKHFNFDYDGAKVRPYYYFLTPTGKDSFYTFEGYLVYQLQKDTFYNEGMEDDATLMRLVAQCDVKNGITTLTNWTPQYDSTSFNQYKYIPTIKVKDTNDNGIIRAFTLTEDAFTKMPLENDKAYYYVVLAYAQNNFKTFDPNTGIGQRSPFVSSPVADVKTLKVTPHKSAAVFSIGETIPITRLDGVGLGDNFLDIQDSMYAKILKNKYAPEITYKAGQGPFTLKVVDPDALQKGKYRIWLTDNDTANNVLENNIRWNFQKEGDAPIVSNNAIDFFNEQILLNYGLSVGIGQSPEVGQSPFNILSNGVILPKVATTKKVEYKDYSKPLWFDAIKNNNNDGLDFIPTDFGQRFYQRDPNQQLSNQIADGLFVPYSFCFSEDGAVGPELRGAQNQNFTASRQVNIYQLNNVDIVLTPDKSKWSRCMVVETFNKIYAEEGLQAQGYTDGSIANMALRKGASVGSDTDPDAPSDGTTGKSWFPGYAIDVETGKRLAVFFGENSAFDVKNNPILDSFYVFSQLPTGSDMIWNPTADKILVSKNGIPQNNSVTKIAGGGHYIYVTDLPYDDWQILYNDASEISNTSKVKTIRNVRWTTAPILAKGTNLLSYAQGLIPNEVKFKLRVQNPYAVYNGVGTHNGYPSYEFWIGDKTIGTITPPQSTTSDKRLLIYPNPSSQVVHVKTEEATIEKINIFSIDGKLIQSTKFEKNQAVQQWTWDLREGISNGIYIISVLTDRGLLQQKCIINSN